MAFFQNTLSQLFKKKDKSAKIRNNIQCFMETHKPNTDFITDITDISTQLNDTNYYIIIRDDNESSIDAYIQIVKKYKDNGKLKTFNSNIQKILTSPLNAYMNRIHSISMSNARQYSEYLFGTIELHTLFVNTIHSPFKQKFYMPIHQQCISTTFRSVEYSDLNIFKEICEITASILTRSGFYVTYVCNGQKKMFEPNDLLLQTYKFFDNTGAAMKNAMSGEYYQLLLEKKVIVPKFDKGRCHILLHLFEYGSKLTSSYSSMNFADNNVIHEGSFFVTSAAIDMQDLLAKY